MPLPTPTIDELIAVLERSRLPTVLVEGAEDLTVYRWLERKLAHVRIDFMGCGGRDRCLQLYARRREFARLHHMFLVDQDLWLFFGKPDGYEGVYTTTGYSIENDTLAGSCIELLFDEDERTVFSRGLNVLSLWFAFELEVHVQGRNPVFNVRLGEILDIQKCEMSEAYKAARRYVEPGPRFVETIRRSPQLMIRGKNLLDLVSAILNRRERLAKYSKAAVLEIAVKSAECSVHLKAIVKLIEREFGRGGAEVGQLL